MTSFGSLHRLLELGRGGMARVWLAVSAGANGFRKLVVVKQLRPEWVSNERVRAMFLDEGRLAAKLNHPNTVQTLEVAEQDNEFYIVMEYLDGQPLDAIQRQGPVPTEALLAILIDVCAGLHHAHELRDLDGTELGVVHRDVSPQNIFVTYTGQVKVVDFGIAKISAGSNSSESGEIKGKINYMSPEQALGMTVDRRADIFSIGVILYAALSGRRLWDQTPENKVIERLRLGDIPSLVPRPAGLNAPNPELIAICNRCLAPAARDRYPTVLDLQLALEDFAQRTGGVFARRELGAFLGRSFEAQRARRRSVIEEKVKALSNGTLISDSVRRTASVFPTKLKGPPVSSVVGAASPSPPPRPSRSSDNRSAAVVSGVAQPQVRVSKSEDARVSSNPTQRPTSRRSSSQPAGVAWRMPEPYKLLNRLSHPGLVFEAKNLETRRGVTVQLLKGALSDEQLALRYSAAARLRHPNTVRLLDVGSVRLPVAVTYIVRENVVGSTLTTILERSSIDPLRAFRIGVGVLRSLQEAHENGVVHGRLSPDHILLEEEDEAGTETPRVLGYWPSNVVVRRESEQAYAAPEQAHGAATVVSDLYSVALILQRCMGTDALGSAAAQHEVPEIDAVFSRALANTPSDRFQTANEMLAALQAVNWSGHAQSIRAISRDRYLLGAMPCRGPLHFSVPRNEMLSTRPVSLWVLEGDPFLSTAAMVDALAEFGGRVEVRHLGEADRELAIEELSTGRVTPPWVMLFGGIHVLVDEPLLQVVKTCAETSRMLVVGGTNFDLTQKCVNDVGLDAQLCLPAEKHEIVSAIERLVGRTRTLTEHYDALRLELRNHRDELNSKSRELAASGSAER